MGVVHHTNYLVWCEMGRTDLLRRLGGSYAELERQGTFLAISEVRIRFRAPARYDDRVRVRTKLAKLRSRGLTFRYVVEEAESCTLLAECETDHVCLDADRTPAKMPGWLIDTLDRAVADVP